MAPQEHIVKSFDDELRQFVVEGGAGHDQPKRPVT